MKWRKKFNSLSDEQREKALKENHDYIVKKLTGTKDPIIGTISQYCSCFENGRILYCFNLHNSEKLFIYYIKSEDEEKIFKEGNIVSIAVHPEHNSYIVDSITLKAEFKN